MRERRMSVDSVGQADQAARDDQALTADFAELDTNQVRQDLRAIARRQVSRPAGPKAGGGSRPLAPWLRANLGTTRIMFPTLPSLPLNLPAQRPIPPFVRAAGNGASPSGQSSGRSPRFPASASAVGRPMEASVTAWRRSWSTAPSLTGPASAPAVPSGPARSARPRSGPTARTRSHERRPSTSPTAAPPGWSR
nr:hypothetical protein - Streptomyces lavendulae plasmid pSLG33 [Streptomyces lavendulae]